VWVPRLLATLKARAWLTTYAAALVVPAEAAWPEIFLMVVQFGGLVLVVWSLGLPTENNSLTFTAPTPRVVPNFSTPAAEVVTRWTTQRESFFTPRGALLTGVVHLVLGGSTSSSFSGKTWVTLREKLRPALLMSESGVSHHG
jgi:hypothetical protein